MTTPKSFHDATTPTESLHVAGFIISNVLRIAVFAIYFPAQMFPLLQLRPMTATL